MLDLMFDMKLFLRDESFFWFGGFVAVYGGKMEKFEVFFPFSLHIFILTVVIVWLRIKPFQT